MGYTDFSLGSLISTYWPVILIVMGIKRFFWLRMSSIQDSRQHWEGSYFWPLGCFFPGTEFRLVLLLGRRFLQNADSGHADRRRIIRHLQAAAGHSAYTSGTAFTTGLLPAWTR
ncbi:hypothetical protein ACFTAO_10835 [Paenibacillus rhizoplanae]